LASLRLRCASSDLKKWERLCVVNLPGVSECPDLFSLSVAGEPSTTKWIFWGAGGNYLIGSFDGRTFKRESGLLRADYGANYRFSRIALPWKSSATTAVRS
jgi:levanase/fructan beta-fructosidase